MNEPKSRAHSQPTVQVVLLTTALEWRAAAAVMQVLRPSLNVEEFIARREELGAEGYCLLGAWVGGQVVSIASYTISPHVTYRRELLIHDMATRPDAQGQGHASSLLEALGAIAREKGCGRIFVHTRNAQSLYARNGFSDYSTGMIKMTAG
jgi:GNAT superfamily N-acetyltransferase